MPNLRIAAVDDAELIAGHRHQMFADNAFATEDRLLAMDARSVPWLRERIRDGHYVGLILEEHGVCVASAGVFFADFPPHYLDAEPVRPYLLNFYTAPASRGQGYAQILVERAVEMCRARGAKVVTLHASKFGKPIYERFGFEQTNEMMLRLEQPLDAVCFR